MKRAGRYGSTDVLAELLHKVYVEIPGQDGQLLDLPPGFLEGQAHYDKPL